MMKAAKLYSVPFAARRRAAPREGYNEKDPLGPDDMHKHTDADSRHAALLANVSFRPVFIISDHRSGTTLLHRLLAETGCFNFVSAYHVIRSPDILANHLEGKEEEARRQVMNQFQQLGVKDRIIDNVPVTPELPVEYGFILSAATGMRRPRITRDTLPAFLELCRKIQVISDPAKPLLLKNPWDVLNFAEIKARFPDSRFIFIHRHPFFILTSQLRAIRSMLAAKNHFAAMIAPWYAQLFDQPLRLFAARFLDSPPFRIWERLLGVHAVRVAEYFLRNIGSLPATDWVSVKYEDLCRQPDETMGKVLQFARVSPAANVSYRDQIEPRPSKVMEEILRTYRRIRPRIQPYLSFHGYEAEPGWMRV